MEIRNYSASQAAREIARGNITSEAFVASCLERVTAREREVHAWAFIDSALALAQARECDQNASRGPLHGVPVAFKDVIDTATMPTEYHSPIYQGHRPKWDAACVALARKAGAVVLGKTATTEFARSYPPATRNPRNLDHTPGGSSSGSAAAVADYMVPIALGTQTGGSTIRPAAFCGVVGYKPSFNTINRAGLKFVSESLDTIGVIARTVEDVALFTHAVSAMALPDFELDPPSAPRVGLCRTATWNDADDATREKLELAAATLAKKGAQVSEFGLGRTFAQIYEDHGTIVDYEAARACAFEYQNHREKLSPGLSRQIETGWKVTRERYANAQRNAAGYRALFSEMLREYDFLLTPSAPGEAPRGIKSTGNAIFNRIWTLLGVPCVTVPAYSGPQGLPIGVQIVGEYGSDAKTLYWAHRVQAMLA